MTIPLFDLFGLALLLMGAALMIGLYILVRRGFSPALRPLKGYEALSDRVGQAVESGGRIHVSLGPNSIIGPETGTTLAGLAMLDVMAQAAAISDRPPVATTGDATALPVISDTLRRAQRGRATSPSFDPHYARLIALDAPTMAAGTTPLIKDAAVQTNILLGSFGSEAVLMTEAGARRGIEQIVGSDRTEGQAIGYAVTDKLLIGEEIYAVRAYAQDDPVTKAGLLTEDLLRWLVAGMIVIGALLQTVGLLR